MTWVIFCVSRDLSISFHLPQRSSLFFTFIVRPWEFWMYPASCFDLYHASLLDTQFSCWWLDLFSLSFLWGHNSGAILLSESKNRIWVSGEVQVPLQNSQPVGLASSGHRESSQQVYHLQRGGKLSCGAALSTLSLCLPMKAHPDCSCFVFAASPQSRLRPLLPHLCIKLTRSGILDASEALPVLSSLTPNVLFCSSKIPHPLSPHHYIQ